MTLEILVRPMPLDGSQAEPYDRLFRPVLGEDFCDMQYLAKKCTESRVVMCWLAFCGGGKEPVGWCSAITPSLYIDAPSSAHLLGNAVVPHMRGFGVGKAMLDHRIRLLGHLPLTVSIRPGNVASESLVASRGFVPVEACGPWVNWLRTPQPSTTAS